MLSSETICILGEVGSFRQRCFDLVSRLSMVSDTVANVSHLDYTKLEHCTKPQMKLFMGVVCLRKSRDQKSSRES